MLLSIFVWMMHSLQSLALDILTAVQSLSRSIGAVVGHGFRREFVAHEYHFECTVVDHDE